MYAVGARRPGKGEAPCRSTLGLIAAEGPCCGFRLDGGGHLAVGPGIFVGLFQLTVDLPATEQEEGEAASDEGKKDGQSDGDIGPDHIPDGLQAGGGYLRGGLLGGGCLGGVGGCVSLEFLELVVAVPGRIGRRHASPGEEDSIVEHKAGFPPGQPVAGGEALTFPLARV